MRVKMKKKYCLKSMLFFMISAMGIYVNVKNKNNAQEKEIEKLQETYSVNDSDLKQAYDKAVMH